MRNNIDPNFQAPLVERFEIEEGTITVHQIKWYRPLESVLEVICHILFGYTPMSKKYRVILWSCGKSLSMTDVVPDIWKYGNRRESEIEFKKRIIANLIKTAEKGGENEERHKGTQVSER